MNARAWLVRPARKTKKDHDLLRAFSCAADLSIRWQAEVEAFIRQSLFDWAFDPRAKVQDPRLLLAFARTTKEIVALAAHERTTLRYQDGEPFAATKLEIAAVSRPWQSRAFDTGERASDVIMSATMADITRRVPPRDARVFAVIHEDNARSIAVARRHGFVEELSRPDPSYRRLMTEHRKS